MGIELPDPIIRLEYCCCCIPLKIGTIVIAVCELVFGLFVASSGMYYYDHWSFWNKDRAVLWLVIGIFALCCVITSILLLVGVFQSNVDFVTPWLICELILIVIFVILGFVQIFVVYGTRDTSNLVSTLVYIIVQTLLRLYFFCVVHNYSKEM